MIVRGLSAIFKYFITDHHNWIYENGVVFCPNKKYFATLDMVFKEEKNAKDYLEKIGNPDITQMSKW